VYVLSLRIFLPYLFIYLFKIQELGHPGDPTQDKPPVTYQILGIVAGRVARTEP